MREQGLAAWRKRQSPSTTRPRKGDWSAADLVKRDFPAAKINTKKEMRHFVARCPG